MVIRNIRYECEKCKGANYSTLADELMGASELTCKRCKSKYTLCSTCQAKGCPKCGGKLENKSDWPTHPGDPDAQVWR